MSRFCAFIGWVRECAVLKSKMAQDALPSQATHCQWLQCGQYAGSFGKWLLFHTLDDLDNAWVLAKSLYESGQLPGVLSIKTSTVRPDARRQDGHHAIVFYTAELPDEQLERIGHQIVAGMRHRPIGTRRYVYYKTNDQTVEGTAATGHQQNHSLCIEVPLAFRN